MKKFILLTTTLLAVLCAHASHEYGGQINLKYISASSYEVKLILWVDSTSINTPSVSYYSVLGTSAATLQTAALVSTTNFGNGIVERTYKDTLQTNFLQGNATVYYQACCRNMLDNVVNANLSDVYFETSVNPAPSQINSSPDFLNAPQFFEGIGDTLLHNPLAADLDGDSLVYSLISPLGSGGTPMVMTANPYPTSSTPGSFSINTSVGDIFWIPSTGGAYGYAVRVDEYRNGIHIGHSIRDARVNICQGCKTAMASDFEFDKTNWNYANNFPSWDVYETVPFTYTFAGSVSGSNTNSISLNVISQADILVNAPSSASTQNMNLVNALFSWTPDLGMAKATPYVTVLIGKETDYANTVRTKEQSILLQVLPKPNNLLDASNQISLILYPNPVKDKLFISTQGVTTKGQLHILSLDGKRLQTIPLSVGTNLAELSIAALQNGIYFIQVEIGSEVLYKKLQVLR